MILEIYRKNTWSDFVELDGIVNVSVVVDQERSTKTGKDFRYFNILYKKYGSYRTGSFNLETDQNGFKQAYETLKNLMLKGDQCEKL